MLLCHAAAAAGSAAFRQATEVEFAGMSARDEIHKSHDTYKTNQLLADVLN
jgi:hypothetical protein